MRPVAFRFLESNQLLCSFFSVKHENLHAIQNAILMPPYLNITLFLT